MGRVTTSIASGIVVGIVTGVPAWSFLTAATWSSIHGGMSTTTLAVLSVVVIAVPLVCGFFAGRAVYRGWLRRGTTELTDPSSSTSSDPHATSMTSVRVNCPHCGCYMERLVDYSTPRYTVVECPIHGPFHFGLGTALTLGPSPRSES
jgi:hypothetical protein